MAISVVESKSFGLSQGPNTASGADTVYSCILAVACWLQSQGLSSGHAIDIVQLAAVPQLFGPASQEAEVL
jgi:hypothetical protein